MDNNQETYKCEKCGHTLLKLNKLLHDLMCKTPLNNNINNNNSSNLINIYPNIINENYYKCEICGILLNFKDKADHLLCHELEKNELNNGNENINFNDDDDYNDNDNDFPYPHYLERQNGNPGDNIINFRNIATNLNNNRDRRFQRIRRAFSFDEDDSLNGRSNNENNNYSDDMDLNDSFDLSDRDPVSEEIILSFPISKIKDISKLNDEKKRCSICLDNYKIGDDSIILPCIHIFHAECIKKWMKKKNSCPICKTKISSDNNDSDF